MEIVPKDSRYTPLTQQWYCCVPTCIQMVMLKHNIPLLPAELIGYEMGLIVPEDEAYVFWHPRTGPRPPAGYGTQGNKKEFGPNKVFKKLKIPLKMGWTPINKLKTITDYKKYLAGAENNGKDIFVCYDWPSLFEPKREGHWGHVCVFDKVYLTKNEVRIIDPDFNAPKWRMVKIDKLFESMKIHGKEKSAGFWELSYTK